MKDKGFLVEEQSDIDRYHFQKNIKTLQGFQGYGTQLISLYIPKSKSVSDVRTYLRNEIGESANIKSKKTRNNVIEGIESALQALKDVDDRDIPKTGIAIFAGHVNVGSQRTKKIKRIVVPPTPLKSFLYRCSSSFELKDLLSMDQSTEIYGIVLVDRQEAAIGYIQGTSLVYVSEFHSDVPRKTRRGGQSSNRFYRRRELLAHYFFNKIGEQAREEFSQGRKVKGLLLGGPGDTKKIFYRNNYLGTELNDLVLKVADVGYSTFLGMREIISAASEVISESPFVKERDILQAFQHGIALNKGIVYGFYETRDSLCTGNVSKILISDSLNMIHRKITCSSCETSEEDIFREDDQEKTDETVICPSCEKSLEEDEIEESDLVDYFIDLSNVHGAEMTLISKNTEEGLSFLETFLGIGGFLRY